MCVSACMRPACVAHCRCAVPASLQGARALELWLLVFWLRARCVCVCAAPSSRSMSFSRSSLWMISRSCAHT